MTGSGGAVSHGLENLLIAQKDSAFCLTDDSPPDKKTVTFWGE